MKPITFTLPDHPISQNITDNEHWTVKSRRNRILMDTVFALCWKAGWRRNWDKFRRVKITFIGCQQMDEGNCIGGSTKGIIDALVKNEIIKDDNPKECQITYLFEEGKQKAVKIELSK